MKNYIWLVRREFWENRAIWIVPLSLGALLVLATLFGRVDIDGLTAQVAPATQEQGVVVGGLILFFSGIVFFALAYVYAFWYLMDCMYADRKDRSILFWKSLPISDKQTVLAKLFTGLIAIPLVYFLAADIATLFMAVIVSLRLRAFIGAALWHPDQWLQLQALWLYLIVTMAVWNLPLAGWLMLVSAWAKKAVILWSILPWVAVFMMERWFFGTHAFGKLVSQWLIGYPAHAFLEPDSGSWVTAYIGDSAITRPDSVWHMMNPAYFFTSAATLACVLVGAVFVAIAIQLRLRRAEA